MPPRDLYFENAFLLNLLWIYNHYNLGSHYPTVTRTEDFHIRTTVTRVQSYLWQLDPDQIQALNRDVSRSFDEETIDQLDTALLKGLGKSYRVIPEV